MGYNFNVRARELDDVQLRNLLREYEQRQNMSSQDFYDAYRAGELDEQREYTQWAILCHMALRQGVLSRTAHRA